MLHGCCNDVDYDLITLSPLSLLSFSCQDQSKRLKVHSANKTTQICQLCSSDDVWNKFTSLIRRIYVDISDSISTDQSLKSFERAEYEPQRSESNSRYASGISELYSLHTYVTMLYETQRCSLRAQTCSGHQRCSSMPAILPSTYVTETAYKPPFRSGSDPNASTKVNDEWLSYNLSSPGRVQEPQSQMHLVLQERIVCCPCRAGQCLCGQVQ